MVQALWKRKTTTMNEFNSPIIELKTINYLDGDLDTISVGSNVIAHKFSEDSKYVFITKNIQPVQLEDVLEINKVKYRVTFVDNPMFMNNHLEIELEKY